MRCTSTDLKIENMLELQNVVQVHGVHKMALKSSEICTVLVHRY